MKQEISEITSEVNEKIRLELFALARHPKVGIWVDSNVMMYSKKEFKKQILAFSELRTVPEVAVEVRRRAKETGYLLNEFSKFGGITVGPDSFRAIQLDLLYTTILSHAASYSPLTQGARAENLELHGSSSPIENNALESLTKKSSFLESPENKIGLMHALGLADEYENACKKLRKSWFKYHREREQRVAAKSYLWTDEKLVASALTDSFAHNCVSVILTTDWDPYVIIKQFADNVIYQSVRIEIDDEQQTIEFDALFNTRCASFDEHINKQRWRQSAAIVDGKLFSSCEPADVFVWHYPTEAYLSFSFNQEFRNWLRTVPASTLGK